MGKFAVNVRSLVINHFDLNLRDYPIFDETYREVLNNKIIEHFYMREIGFETAGLFKFMLNRTMNEIMPLYNQYYKSALLEFNPMHDKDLTITDSRTRQEDQTRETKDTSTGNTSLTSDGTTSGTSQADTTSTGHEQNKGDNLNVFSETPQSILAIGDIKTNTYATNATMEDNTNVTDSTDTTNQTGETSGTSHATNEGTSTNTLDGSLTGNIQTTEEYTSHIVGMNGMKNFSQLLLDFRETFLNIDMMVINDKELQNCFLLLYD